MKKTVPLSIPNKKINYSPQFRNMVEGENIVFGQEGNRVETINTDVIELLKVKTPEVSMKDYVITATCATEGAEIFYTSDGSTPTVLSTLYQGPISVIADGTFRFIAVKNGMIDSDEAEMEVEIHILDPEIYLDYRTGMVTMINPNGAGDIYYTQHPYTYDSRDPVKQGKKYTGPIDSTYPNGNYFNFIIVLGELKSNYVKKFFNYQFGGASYTTQTDWQYGLYDVRFTTYDNVKITYSTDGSVPDFNDPEITNGMVIYPPIYGHTLITESMFSPDAIPAFNCATAEFGYASKPTAPSISVNNNQCTLERAGETTNITYWPYLSSDLGCCIVYTTDGSEPTLENGTIYNTPFNPGSFPVTPGMTIKAITVCYGKDISEVSTFTVE